MPSVVITGASQGIGAAVARAFASESDARIVLISRSAERLEEVAASCRAAGAETLVIPCDVTIPDEVTAAGERILAAWGIPDVLVNNAGQFQPGSLTETSIADFRYQVDVNVNSAFYVTRMFLEGMKQRGSGTIFFMTSVAGIRAYPGGAAYCVGKHGLLGLARVTREETRGTGVRSTAIVLGATYTPSWHGAGLPEERFIPVEDVADAVMSIYRMSDRTNVEEILIRPRDGDI